MKENHLVEIERNLKLWVETFGNRGNEACVFISGAGANSSFWSDCLCEKLEQEGFFAIKYDHRDIGFSSKTDFENNPYNLLKLAEDVLSIINSFEIEKAHFIGHSMGGFIVQLLAIHFPERVISITSASSSTNSLLVPPPPEKTWQIFMENSPTNNYEKDLKGFMPIWEYLNGTATFDKELAIEYTKNLYERQEIKGAIGENHVKAQTGLTDRTELLKKTKIPTLVIHGEEDYLVNKFGGIQTAACIRNARLVLIPQMGHMLFNQNILERFSDEIFKFINHNRNENT